VQSDVFYTACKLIKLYQFKKILYSTDSTVLEVIVNCASATVLLRLVKALATTQCKARRPSAQLHLGLLSECEMWSEIRHDPTFPKISKFQVALWVCLCLFGNTFLTLKVWPSDAVSFQAPPVLVPRSMKASNMHWPNQTDYFSLLFLQVYAWLPCSHETEYLQSYAALRKNSKPRVCDALRCSTEMAQVSYMPNSKLVQSTSQSMLTCTCLSFVNLSSPSAHSSPMSLALARVTHTLSGMQMLSVAMFLHVTSPNVAGSDTSRVVWTRTFTVLVKCRTAQQRKIIHGRMADKRKYTLLEWYSNTLLESSSLAESSTHFVISNWSFILMIGSCRGISALVWRG